MLNQVVSKTLTRPGPRLAVSPVARVIRMSPATSKPMAPAPVEVGAGCAASRSVDWERVRDALADGRWRFRSVEGIVVETGLERGTVEEMLQEHCAEVRAILARSHCFSGVRRVYTLRSRPVTLREIAVDLCAFASR